MPRFSTALLALNLGLIACDDYEAPQKRLPPSAAGASAEKAPEAAAPSGVCRDRKEFDSAAACEGHCAANDANACWVLGVLHADANGVPEDRDAATKAFQRACELGSGDGCNEVGVAYRNGWGGLAKDDAKMNEFWARARPLFDEECGSGRATSCFQLGRFYEEGKGGEPDPDKAAELFEKACDLGSKGGCSKAGK